MTRNSTWRNKVEGPLVEGTLVERSKDEKTIEGLITENMAARKLEVG